MSTVQQMVIIAFLAVCIIGGIIGGLFLNNRDDRLRKKAKAVDDQAEGQDEMTLAFEAEFSFAPRKLYLEAYKRTAVVHLATLLGSPKNYGQTIRLLRYFAPTVAWAKLADETAVEIAAQMKRTALAASQPPERGLDFITFPSNPNDE